MGSVGHRRARALVARYLDPRRPWTAAQDTPLRAHLAACDACRAAYDQAVVAHRVLVGADPAFPSGFEARRRMDALLGSAEPSRPPRWSSLGLRGALAGALAAAAAVALVALGPWRAAPEDLRPRGAAADAAAPLAGLGVSGVGPAGEYEVVASDGARRGDWLRFTYTVEATDAAPTHLFVFGLQPGRAPLWYAPMPPDETASLPVAPGRFVPLPFESRLSERHADGPLTVVALFTRHPLTVDEVAAALPAGLWPDGPLPGAAFVALVRDRLALGPDAVVQLLPTRVLAPPPPQAEVR